MTYLPVGFQSGSYGVMFVGQRLRRFHRSAARFEPVLPFYLSRHRC